MTPEAWLVVAAFLLFVGAFALGAAVVWRN
jgi:hypothetical protein